MGLHKLQNKIQIFAGGEGPKNLNWKLIKYLVYQYKILEYNEVWFSPCKNQEKKNYFVITGCLIFDVRQKR